MPDMLADQGLAPALQNLQSPGHRRVIGGPYYSGGGSLRAFALERSTLRRWASALADTPQPKAFARTMLVPFKAFARAMAPASPSAGLKELFDGGCRTTSQPSRC